MHTFEYGRGVGTDEAIATVQGIYAAFARRDLDGVLALISADVELRPAGTARLTGRAVYRGHAGMREYFDDVQRVWDELRLHADDIRAVGNNVVVFGHVTGRIGPDAVVRRAVWTWRVRDGLAVSLRVADLGSADA